MAKRGAKPNEVRFNSLYEVQEINGGHAIYLVVYEEIEHKRTGEIEVNLVRCKKLSPVFGDKHYAEMCLPQYRLDVQ